MFTARKSVLLNSTA